MDANDTNSEQSNSAASLAGNVIGLAISLLYGVAALFVVGWAAVSFGLKPENYLGMSVIVLLFVPTGLLALRASRVFVGRFRGAPPDQTVPWWYAATISGVTYPVFALLLVLAPDTGMKQSTILTGLVCLGFGFLAWPLTTWLRRNDSD